MVVIERVNVRDGKGRRWEAIKGRRERTMGRKRKSNGETERREAKMTFRWISETR